MHVITYINREGLESRLAVFLFFYPANPCGCQVRVVRILAGEAGDGEGGEHPGEGDRHGDASGAEIHVGAVLAPARVAEVFRFEHH